MIKVKNWSSFQHYKDRNPPWIKLSTTLFQDYDFASLSDASKLLAICIWTLASRYKDPLAGLVPHDIRWIKNQCNLGENITEKTLQDLANKGFIEIASKPLAGCKQSAIPETETETETEKRKNTKKEKLEKPDDVTQETWDGFLILRKTKKAPVTKTVLKTIRREADKASWSLEDVLQECCARGWQGFKADWVLKMEESHGRQHKLSVSTLADEAQQRVLERYGIGKNSPDHGAGPSMLRHSGHLRQDTETTGNPDDGDG